MAVGGLPEKILTAFQSVLDEHSTEEAALSKCNATVHHVGKIEEDVECTLTQGKSSAVGFDVLTCYFLLKAPSSLPHMMMIEGKCMIYLQSCFNRIIVLKYRCCAVLN